MMVASSSELDMWQQKCEQLVDDHAACVRVLEAEQVQRRHLEEAESALQRRLAELTTAQARMAGHQNPNQRIQHLMQLKDQVQDLQKQNGQLRMELSAVGRMQAKREGSGKAYLDLSHMSNLVSTVVGSSSAPDDVISSLRALLHK